MKKKIGNQGQTIVEAIVVLGIVVLLVTGLIAGTTSSLRSVQAGRTRSQALKYAEEGIEVVRNLRNNEGWSTFTGYAGSHFLDTSLDETFKREVDLTLDGTTMTVVVTVSYTDGSETKNVTLTSYFTDWK